jgi:hypothetical protein
MFTYLHTRLLLCSLGIWAAATLVLRAAGQHVLHPGDPVGTIVLFAVSFPLMAWAIRRLCRRFRLPRDQWLAGAVSALLPTLLLDPISCAFFQAVFPNMVPESAGLFGGWMLWCCAGALMGALVGGRSGA